MQVAIVKYNAGNIYSVVNALRRMGIEPLLTDDAELLKKADRVLFPGQGHAGEAMDYLRARKLDLLIRDLKQPVFGICVGQQLLCKHSEEGDTDCIGIFDAEVKRFQPQRHEDKVPHMGWNTIETTSDGIFKGFTKPEFVYFVHSFYVPVCEWTAARTEYILPFTASLHKDNFYASQFHPEKSGPTGERILKNFLDI